MNVSCLSSPCHPVEENMAIIYLLPNSPFSFKITISNIFIDGLNDRQGEARSVRNTNASTCDAAHKWARGAGALIRYIFRFGL